MATILIVTATGPTDVTRASVPFHIGVNGVAASGNRCGIALAGDATDLVKEEHRYLHGVGVPPLADLLTGCVERGVDVYV
jgi:predicted peroxiredoxin